MKKTTIIRRLDYSFTSEMVSEISGLIKQISPSVPDLDKRTLERCLTPPSVVISATDNNKVVGIIMAVVYWSLSGLKARIEDFSVSAEYRRQGIGESMLYELLKTLYAKGTKEVSLSCNPTRHAATILYKKAGFRKPHTNIYYRKTEKNNDIKT